jgi:hypothetical protein
LEFVAANVGVEYIYGIIRGNNQDLERREREKERQQIKTDWLFDVVLLYIFLYSFEENIICRKRIEMVK